MPLFGPPDVYKLKKKRDVEARCVVHKFKAYLRQRREQTGMCVVPLCVSGRKKTDADKI
jgi:hypothetical protein